MSDRKSNILNRSQQYVLRLLGYYKGKLDGAWGKVSEDAMRTFQALPEYVGGFQSKGRPLEPFQRLPANCYWGKIHGQNGVIYKGTNNEHDGELYAEQLIEAITKDEPPMPVSANAAVVVAERGKGKVSPHQVRPPKPVQTPPPAEVAQKQGDNNQVKGIKPVS